MAKKETPRPFMVRLYKKHRKSIKVAARVYKLSEAEVIRRAIEIASQSLWLLRRDWKDIFATITTGLPLLICKNWLWSELPTLHRMLGVDFES
jgi:hypothetical protein